jgi:hypothetical protein
VNEAATSCARTEDVVWQYEYVFSTAFASIASM